eukprot:GFYU01012236.1.p1 GENE.GFYU01012236.1~~GFYU01012236.1.p1  ORF type:complete len:404 (-),score=119.38 GFYU01012236.1:28-1239(-)
MPNLDESGMMNGHNATFREGQTPKSSQKCLVASSKHAATIRKVPSSKLKQIWEKYTIRNEYGFSSLDDMQKHDSDLYICNSHIAPISKQSKKPDEPSTPVSNGNGHANGHATAATSNPSKKRKAENPPPKEDSKPKKQKQRKPKTKEAEHEPSEHERSDHELKGESKTTSVTAKDYLAKTLQADNLPAVPAVAGSLPDRQKKHLKYISHSMSGDLEDLRKVAPPLDMTSYDRQLDKLTRKDQQILDEISRLQREKKALLDGVNPDFIKQSRSLERLKEERITAATKAREIRFKQVDQSYELDMKIVDDEFEEEKAALKRKIENRFLDRQRDLEEYYARSTGGQYSRRVPTRKLRHRKADGDGSAPLVSSAPKKRPPPNILGIMQLGEDDVTEDLAVMKTFVKH